MPAVPKTNTEIPTHSVATLVEKYLNDQDLGREVRKLLNKIREESPLDTVFGILKKKSKKSK